MKASELRVNSYYYLSGQPYKLTEEGFELVVVFKTKDRLAPIPLTKESMLRLGFGRREDIFYLIIQTGQATHSIYINICIVDGKVYADMHIGQSPKNKMLLDIQFVHELQNLHFALIGEELDFDETKDKP